MPWKECSVMDERVRFVGRLLDGEKMVALCREFAISRKTGYKIFDRYKEYGLEALTDRSRKPWRYANQLPQQVEAAILNLKREKPYWGARKIRERLLRRFSCEVKVPARSTIHAVLDRHGLVQRRGRRRHHAQGTPLSLGQKPNELWCTDYKSTRQPPTAIAACRNLLMRFTTAPSTSPTVGVFVCTAKKLISARSSRVRRWESKKSKKVFGWLALWITISATSTWRKKLCSLSTTLWPKRVTYVFGTICHPCLRAGPLAEVAERVGFEPTVRFPARSLSRRVLSTAQPPLRGRCNRKFNRGICCSAM